MRTKPDVHREKATAANAAFSDRWKPVVKMVKKWNDHHDKPVEPSFLLEVMALELLDPPWAGSYPRELRQLFATAARAIDEEWDDPAGLGPPVTARLAENSWERRTAKQALTDAEAAAATEALRFEQSGVSSSIAGVSAASDSVSSFCTCGPASSFRCTVDAALPIYHRSFHDARAAASVIGGASYSPPS